MYFKPMGHHNFLDIENILKLKITIFIDGVKIMIYNKLERMFDMFCKEE
jgi:hypothetical protein